MPSLIWQQPLVDEIRDSRFHLSFNLHYTYSRRLCILPACSKMTKRKIFLNSHFIKQKINIGALDPRSCDTEGRGWFTTGLAKEKPTPRNKEQWILQALGNHLKVSHLYKEEGGKNL